MLEKYYPYYIGETKHSNFQALSDTPLWSCQSHEFGKKLGEALKQLHDLPTNKKVSIEDRFAQQLSETYLTEFKRCKKFLKSNELIFECQGYPIQIIEDVFFSYEDLQIEDENVYVHGDLSCEQIILNKNYEFSGIKNWQNFHVGNRGRDLSIAWLILEEPVAKTFFKTYGQVEESQFELSLFQSLYSSLLGFVQAHKTGNEGLKQWMGFALKKSIGL